MNSKKDLGYTGPMNQSVLKTLGHNKYMSWIIAENRDHSAVRCLLLLTVLFLAGALFASFKVFDPITLSKHRGWIVLMVSLMCGIIIAFALKFGIDEVRAQARKEYLVLWALYCPESVDDAGKAMMDSDTNFILSFSHNNRAELIEAIRKRLNAKLATALYYLQFLASDRLLQEFEKDFAGADFSDLRTKYAKEYEAARLAVVSTSTTTQK